MKIYVYIRQQIHETFLEPKYGYLFQKIVRPNVDVLLVPEPIRALLVCDHSSYTNKNGNKIVDTFCYGFLNTY